MAKKEVTGQYKISIHLGIELVIDSDEKPSVEEITELENRLCNNVRITTVKELEEDKKRDQRKMKNATHKNFYRADIDRLDEEIKFFKHKMSSYWQEVDLVSKSTVQFVKD
jgi:hypothetical protein